MSFDQGVALLKEFGFPVFVAWWFMFRLEKRVDRLCELVTSLMQATALLAKSVDDHIDYTRTTGTVKTLKEGEDG